MKESGEMNDAGGAEPKKNEPEGIGGWLLLFCVGQVFLGPGRTLQELDKIWERIGPHAFPVVRQITMIETVVTLLIVLYGMIVGILVWRRHRTGRSLARQYLSVRIVVVGLLCILMTTWAYCSFGAMASKRVAVATIPLTAGEIGVAILWWCYFTYSKRVKNTFSEPSAA